MFFRRFRHLAQQQAEPQPKAAPESANSGADGADAELDFWLTKSAYGTSEGKQDPASLDMLKSALGLRR